ncbi:MAG: PAS sensor protein [Denitrovibrio sp.]|nr:MAG: PAS sensor protein [Denitrovibrio sp.]
MSELLNSSDERVDALYNMFAGFIEKKDGRELWDEYKHKLDALTPVDVLLMGDKLLEAGYSVEQITDHVEKIFNVIIPTLKEYDWNEPEEGSALYYLMEENAALSECMNEMKDSIRAISKLEPNEPEYASVLNEMKEEFKKLAEFEPHYVKTENVLFPYLEKKWEFSKPLTVLWAVNDEIRNQIKKVNKMLSESKEIEIEHHQEIGTIFMLMMRMTLKENLIIFPAAAATLSEEDSKEMLPQMADIGFCLIDPPKIDKMINEIPELSNEIVSMGGTGALTAEQIVTMMNHLPVDITFVDENDEVRYFSNPKERFFTRSPAIIGRKVQNCHPPDSVDTVLKIVEGFKNGKKDTASFWIRMMGKVIMINYYALRDAKGTYKGTIEVSQDITDIQKLEGEQRLLDWED